MKQGSMNIGYLILRGIMIKFFNIATIFLSPYILEIQTKAFTDKMMALQGFDFKINQQRSGMRYIDDCP